MTTGEKEDGMSGIDNEWLKRKIASDPDTECEAGTMHPEAMTETAPSAEGMDAETFRERLIKRANEKCATVGYLTPAEVQEIVREWMVTRADLAAARAERDEAVTFIRIISDELTNAGGGAGDRTVALANLRAVVKGTG
jgi:2-keto-4-pentenoate hydratase